MKLKTCVVALLGVFFLGSLAFGADPMAPIDPAKYEGKIKVACVGDSITQGAGTKGNPYPKQLQEMLGDKWEVGNFGVSGRTLMDKGDHPYSKEKKYQDALAMKPDVVIIMLGTNDTKPQNWKFKDEFEADYKKLIKSFQDLESKPRIYICRACPVIGKGAYKITEEGIQEQIPIVNKIAAELSLGIIDMYAALKDTPELIPDKVHPNAEGGGKMAAAAAAVLTGKKAGE
jgi:lysophospholipase L1-like esterase